jgi:hypothetical protein
MKEILLLERKGCDPSQDLHDCVAILKRAGIWADADVCQPRDWYSIVLVSHLPEAVEILRARGFRVIEPSQCISALAVNFGLGLGLSGMARYLSDPRSHSILSVARAMTPRLRPIPSSPVFRDGFGFSEGQGRFR